METNLVKSHYFQAYECECGHIMERHQLLSDNSIIDAKEIYNCCPQCGRSHKEWKLYSGRWVYRIDGYKTTGWLKKKQTPIMKELQFEPSIHDQE